MAIPDDIRRNAVGVDLRPDADRFSKSSSGSNSDAMSAASGPAVIAHPPESFGEIRITVRSLIFNAASRASPLNPEVDITARVTGTFASGGGVAEIACIKSVADIGCGGCPARSSRDGDKQIAHTVRPAI